MTTLSLPLSTRPKTTVSTVPVTLLRGDGVGPEVADAVVRILNAADAPIAWEDAPAGEAAFACGVRSGVPEHTLESIARTGVVLKGRSERLSARARRAPM